MEKTFAIHLFNIILIRLRVGVAPITVAHASILQPLKVFQLKIITFYISDILGKKHAVAQFDFSMNNVSSGKVTVPHHFYLGPNTNRG